MSRAYRALIRHGLRRGLPSRAGFSRRDFLKRSTRLAGAAMLAPLVSGGIGCATGGSRESSAGRGMKVIVIGAGFAGLACADTLRRSGAEVTVLEALVRPGGRVLTDRHFIRGKNVELGGEFIGENHPTWISYAKRFNLELQELEEYQGDEPIILDGKLVRGEEVDKLYEQIDAGIEKLIELARPVDAERPFDFEHAEELDKMSFLDIVKKMELTPPAEKLMLIGEEADNGVPPERMSLLAYCAMIKGGGLTDYYELSETHRLARGNDALATALTRSLGNRVRFRSAVVSIERRPGSVLVQTNEARSYEADAIVLTIPPSVWSQVKFTPELPANLTPQMASNVKLLLSLNKPVWEEQGLTPDATSNGLVNYTWVSANHGEPPLGFTFFSGSRYSEQLRSLGPAERVKQAVASVSPAFPNLLEAVNETRFMDWPSRPRARASYAFPAPGEVRAMGETLVDGIDDDLAPLKFAGEYTSYAFMGYMEGALSSGVRAAKQLIEQRAGMSLLPSPSGRGLG